MNQFMDMLQTVAIVLFGLKLLEWLFDAWYAFDCRREAKKRNKELDELVERAKIKGDQRN